MGSFEAFSRVGGWDKYEHYFPVYDRFLTRFQGRPLRMLEIGVSLGGSIAGWREFFGAGNLTYYGIDIDPACRRFATDGVTIFIGDQADKTFVDDIAGRLPELDIVIDDGGHVARQQITSFETFFPKLTRDGVYVVEDTHTSFWPDFQSDGILAGQPQHNIGALDFLRSLTNAMMERWWSPVGRERFLLPRAQRPEKPAGYYARTIQGISFFDSIVVIEKGEVAEPLRLKRR